jgi:hypothetical protein
MEAILNQQKAELDSYHEKDKQRGQSVQVSNAGNLWINFKKFGLNNATMYPSKYADGKQYVNATKVPCVFNLDQAGKLSCHIELQLDGAESKLWYEKFIQPVQVVAIPRGPKANQQAPQAPPTQQFQPPQQTQLPPQPYIPPNTPQPAVFQQAPTMSTAPTADDNLIVTEAQQLMKYAPSVYKDLPSAIRAVRVSKNLPV